MSAMTERLVRIVSLWLRSGADPTAFEAFESKAARIMARHGGRIEQAVRVQPTKGEEAPFEVHIVSFPSEAAYAAYRADPEILALADERDRVISRTRVLAGRPAGPYEASC